MNRIPLVLLLSIALGSSVRSQSVEMWYVGTEEPDYDHTIVGSWRTDDGGAIIEQEDPDGSRIHRVSNTGSVLWSNSYAIGTPTATTSNMAATGFPDGSAALVRFGGWPPGPGSVGEYRTCIVRIAPDGSVMWGRKVTISHPTIMTSHYRFSLHALSGGALLVFGRDLQNQQQLATVLLKVDADGEVVYAVPGTDELCDQSTTDIVIGANDEVTMVSPSVFFGRNYISRWNGAGERQWAKSVEMTNSIWSIEQVRPAVDTVGNAYVFGQQHGPTSVFPFLFKVNDDGSFAWFRVYGSGSSIDNPSARGRCLANGNLDFGIGRHTVFSPDGDVVERYRWNFLPPPNTPDSITWWFSGVTVEEGEVVLHGARNREDPLFSFQWSRPTLYKGLLPGEGNCLWVRANDPLDTDTIVPMAYLEVLDLPAFETLTVTAVDTVTFLVEHPVPATEPINCGSITGLEEGFMSMSSMQLFPDPVTQGMPVDLLAPSNSRFTVVDAQGKAHGALRSTYYGRAMINTEELPPGVYFVRVADAMGAHIGTLRLVVL